MEKFEQWCIVELMGHQKIAGKCTEQTIAGANMLRVDVPATNKQSAFTRFYNSTAIYCIHPVDERTVEITAEKLHQQPITIWDLEEIIKSRKLLPVSNDLSSISEMEIHGSADPDFEVNDDEHPY